MRRFLFLSILAFAPVYAAQIILAPGNVIGHNGEYGATFDAPSIFDHQAGPISEPLQDGSYWLNSDNGPTGAYIVIDLGASFHLTLLELFNTHNAHFDDRGTGNFSFEAANSVAPTAVPGAVGMDLSGPIVTILNGALVGISMSGDPIVSQTFAVSDPGSYRYIKFEPHSVAVGGTPCCGSNVYGLNELRAFEGPVTIPEPGSIAMLIGGIVGLVAARRRLIAR